LVEELRHPHAVFGVEGGHQQRMRITEIEQPHPDRDEREESDASRQDFDHSMQPRASRLRAT